MVKMPHGNRVQSSVVLNTSDMWTSTIGHDPYAAGADADDTAAARLNAEKTKTLLEIARKQNLDKRNNDGNFIGGGGSGSGGGTGGTDDYAQKMFFGLNGKLWV